MAAFTRDTFVVYDEQYQMGMIEELADKIDLFNAAGGNTLLLNMGGIIGDSKVETFLPDDGGYDDRRDESSLADYTFKDIVQKERRIVDIAGMNGYEKTLSSWYKIAQTPEALSRIAGVLMARARTRTFLRDSFSAISGTIDAIGSAVKLDVTGETTSTMTPEYLNEALAKFEDMSSNLTAMICHSKVRRDMIGNAITEKVFNVADLALKVEYVPMLGRLLIETDNPSMYEAIAEWVSDTDGGSYSIGDKVVSNGIVYKNKTGTNTNTAPASDSTNWEVAKREYYSYLLSNGACEIKQGVMDSVLTQIEIRKDNSVGYIKAEYNCNIGVKGMSWKSTSGTNPSVAALATSSNWEKVATSIKHTAGVKIISY